jgi:Na+/proline symporter
MKAVIWTDVLQAVVILVGLLAAIIQGEGNRLYTMIELYIYING